MAQKPVGEMATQPSAFVSYVPWAMNHDYVLHDYVGYDCHICMHKNYILWPFNHVGRMPRPSQILRAQNF
jgi:hypothetical protein